VKILSF
jgi:hypothetical protein